MNQSSAQIKNPLVCFVHDWLVAMRGGEKVLEAMAELFPEAPIYTLFLKREKLSPELQKREIHTSFLQKIPGITHIYRWLLPLFPIAIRSLNVKKYDVVISSSHCVAKAVKVRERTIHICYCHTPMRYLWGFSEEYLGKLPLFIRSLIEFYFKLLRKWDIKTSQRVTAFLANSKNTAEKINTLYGKSATVIHPPVEAHDNIPNNTDSRQESYFLIVSALVPYKRIDVAIEAFNQLRQTLKIVGDGPQRPRLESMVRYTGIQFEGLLSQEALWRHYTNCHALIFPGEEDFGIVPLEAQMFGKPVIAFGKGGALETVLAYNDREANRSLEQSTGLFFYQQNADALIEQVKTSKQLQFNPIFIREHAQNFNRDRFKRELANFIENHCGNLRLPGHATIARQGTAHQNSGK